MHGILSESEISDEEIENDHETFTIFVAFDT